MIIFVGKRSLALRAARNLNLPFKVWTPGETLPSASGVRAVIPLTEQAVVHAGLLAETLGLDAFTTEQAERCHDKFKMKERALAARLPITDFVLLKGDEKAADIIARLGLPVVLKLRTSSGSRGLKIAHSQRDLEMNLQPGILAERFVNGKEISIEIFVAQGEIQFANFTEYYEHHTINILPAPIDEVLSKKLLDLARRVVNAYDFRRGLMHIEVYVTKDDVLLGEFAIRPPGGYIMHLLKYSYKFNPWEALLRLHLQQQFSFPREALYVSAVHILHPGMGTIKKISGIEKIQQIKDLKQIKIKAKIGQHISAREGSGQDIGRIVYVGNSYKEVRTHVEHGKSALKIEMEFHN